MPPKALDDKDSDATSVASIRSIKPKVAPSFSNSSAYVQQLKRNSSAVIKNFHPAKSGPLTGPPKIVVTQPDGKCSLPPNLQQLQPLLNLEMVNIKHKVLLGGNARRCCEDATRFIIEDEKGNEIFTCRESACCMNSRFLCSGRSVTVEVADTEGNNVIFIERPTRCTCNCCCFNSCMQQITVESPQCNKLGLVQQQPSLIKTSLVVFGPAGIQEYSIFSPAFTYKMCGDAKFNIHPIESEAEADGGKITKVFSSPEKTGKLELKFPPGASVSQKATLIGGAILVNYMFFDH